MLKTYHVCYYNESQSIVTRFYAIYQRRGPGRNTDANVPEVMTIVVTAVVHSHAAYC